MPTNKQKIREQFRQQVFKRDGNKCSFCDKTTKLDAHHITDRSLMPNGGYVKENGITLCPEHHYDAEMFNISAGDTWIIGMHPNDLYNRINSSIDLAIDKSERLKDR